MRSWSNLIKFSGALFIVIALVAISVTRNNVGASGLPQAATASATTLPPTAMPAANTPVPAGTPASATARCIPAEVTVFTNSPRIHVKCTAPTNNILYFAASTENMANAGTNNPAAAPNPAANADRVLAVFNTAIASSHALAIVYDPADTSGQAFGCLPENCRLIISVSIVR